jgi:U32 family peptidase
MCERPLEAGSRRPEIVAPAGDAASMRAAVGAGADAVYFGLRGFNARGGAENVDADGIAGAMRFLHENGVRGYVALNTLVFDDELGGVEAGVRACAAAGVDAIVVQDLGAIALARAIAPDIKLHASTQMTCTDAGAIGLAARMGVKRVIVGRELSVDEIAAVRAETDVELEVFVHGALCVSYSGQCLASQALGGRSGNRGECAQPCRLVYRLVVDGELRDLGDRAYLLSPADLEATAFVQRLTAMGVAALKIEGRLKSPEYVSAVTRLYRNVLDGEHGTTSEDRALALQTFSRGSGPGFLAGDDHQRLVEGRSSDHRGTRVGVYRGRTDAHGKTYLSVALEAPIARGDGVLVEGGFAGDGEVGGRVWGLVVRGQDSDRASKGDEALVWLGPDKQIQQPAEGRRVYRTDDPRGEKQLRAEPGQRRYRIPVKMRVSGRLGDLPSFEASADRGVDVRVLGDCVLEEAHRAPLNVAAVREKLARLGETPFELRSLEADWPDNAIVPVSSLNRAKRAMVGALLRSFEREWATTGVTHGDLLSAARPPECEPLPGGLFVLCRVPEQAAPALEAGADGVYLDLADFSATRDAVRSLRAFANAMIGVALVRIRKPGEERIDRQLETLCPDTKLVRSLGALGDGLSEIPQIADFSLNVTNVLSAQTVLAQGPRAFTPSLELGAGRLMSMLGSPFGRYAEVVVHHREPLFHTEHCLAAALLSEGRDRKTCARPCERHELALRDRKGLDHPVMADVGCRNTVFGAAPRSAAGAVRDMKALGVARYRIELVREPPDEVRAIVGAYRQLLDGCGDGQGRARH